MKELLQYLASRGAALNPPASPDEVRAIEARMGGEIPREAQEFYLIANGLSINECLDLPPLDRAVEYFQDVASPLFRTLLVILDEHESNPICLFFTGPLRGHVAQVFHDGDSHVRWRSVKSLLQHIASQLPAEDEDAELDDLELDVDKLPNDFDDPKRTDADIAAGRAMIEFARSLELHSADSPLAYTFAFDLLGDDQVPEITPFLEHEDMFVARAARERLAAIKGPAAQAALQAHLQDVKHTLQTCVDILRRAGRDAHVINELNIRIDPGPQWLDWEALFSQKGRPDFAEWVASRGRKLG